MEDIHFEPAQDESCTAENKIIWDQIQKDLKGILKKNPAEQKEIIILKMYENRIHKEIAILKNISINTSLGRYRYALINLRKIAIMAEKNGSSFWNNPKDCSFAQIIYIELDKSPFF